jgi:hypothetical protein
VHYAAALPSCLRTAAAELPTLSIASCSSSRDTPKCFVQYFTSCSLAHVDEAAIGVAALQEIVCHDFLRL